MITKIWISFLLAVTLLFTQGVNAQTVVYPEPYKEVVNKLEKPVKTHDINLGNLRTSITTLKNFLDANQNEHQINNALTIIKQDLENAKSSFNYIRPDLGKLHDLLQDKKFRVRLSKSQAETLNNLVITEQVNTMDAVEKAVELINLASQRLKQRR